MSRAKPTTAELSAFLSQHFSRISPAALKIARRDLKAALEAVLVTQERESARPRLGDVREDLDRLEAAFAKLDAEIEGLSPRTAALLRGVIADKTFTFSGALGVTPGDVGPGTMRQIRRVCLDAQEWIAAARKRAKEKRADKWSGAVAGLDGFLWSVRPIWRNNSPLPFNSSTFWPDAQRFVVDALALVGLAVPPSSLRRAIIVVAKQAAKDERDARREGAPLQVSPSLKGR